MSTGTYHACALRDTGEAVCWGDSAGGRNMPPPGLFTEVIAAGSHTCGRRPTGIVVCWGESSVYNPYLPATTVNFRAPIARLAAGGGEICAIDELGSTHCQLGVTAVQPPGGRFRSLSLNANGGCGIGRDDRALCWGAAPAGVPSGPMTAVSLGTSHACAIGEDGGVRCWGDNGMGQTNAPAGAFVEIAVAAAYSCALRTDGALICWGQGAGIPTAPVGSGYRNLSANTKRVCAIGADARPQCWGSDVASIHSSYFTTTADAFAHSEAVVCKLTKPNSIACFRLDGGPPLTSWLGSNYDQLVADGATVCTIENLRRVRCHLLNFDGPMRMAGVGGIASGSGHFCNLRADGGISCFGSDTAGQRTAPPMSAKAIDANGSHACALGADHRLRCWGDDTHAGSQPPSMALRDFDVGQLNGCGVGSDAAVVCWGWNVNGQGTPPVGAFRRVATGLNHSCGIRDTGTLACWGYGADGQITAPTGAFVAVDVGERHSCAISAVGQLRCWGLNSEGQATPPAIAGETWRALAVGAFHACAIRSGGELACWGRNGAGQAIPPTGRFLDVSAGLADSCAIREDGIRLCWGANASGQSPSIAFASTPLPPLRYGNDYATALRVEGVSGYRPFAPSFSVMSGVLPTGLALQGDGRLAGRSTAWGDYGFVVMARDDNGIAVARTIRLVNVWRRSGPLPATPVATPSAAGAPAIATPPARAPSSPRRRAVSARCPGCDPR